MTIVNQGPITSTWVLHQGVLGVVSALVSDVCCGSIGGDQERGEMAAMKERIQQLEAQLAREKMKTVPGSQTVQQSSAHAGLVYGNTDSQSYHVPVQQYATRVQVRRE